VFIPPDELLDERVELDVESVFASFPHQHFKTEPRNSLPFAFTIAVDAAA